MSRPYSGVTGSSSYDVAACPSRAAIPVKAFTSSEYADRGNTLHEFLRALALWPERREELLISVPEEWRHTAQGIDLSAALDGLQVKRLEVSYALDVKNRSCRWIGDNIDRKYNEHLVSRGEPGLGEWEIPFTIDVEALSGATPVELDWKSGQYLGDPAEQGQRKIHATGLMLFHGSATAISRVGYIDDNGAITPDGCEFSIWDAFQTCDDLVKMIEDVWAARDFIANDGVPAVYPNREKQCKYCPAFTACPYWTNLAKSCLDTLRGYGDLSELPTDKLGQVFDYVKDVAKIVEVMEEQLKAHVYSAPLPVNETYEYRAEPKRGRSWFDAAAARGMIATLLSQMGEDEEAVADKIRALTKPGKQTLEVRKRKRLDVMK